MAVGAHADDVELGAGGTLLRLASLGRKGVLVDMTDASLGTRGTPAIRVREAAAAARLLKVEAPRVNLGLPDGRLTDPSLDAEAERLLVEAIRRHRPKVVITHHWREEHPDHGRTAELVKRAVYKAGLAKLDVPGESFRPGRIFHFIGEALHEPSFCVDITPFWRGKLAAVLAYESQFHQDQPTGRASARGARAARAAEGPGADRFGLPTDLATPAFLENLEARNRFWGIRIKRRYAEAFVCAELPEVGDLTDLGGERFP
jgi:bacillithiol biosynthesis deacetylase BshB1